MRSVDKKKSRRSTIGADPLAAIIPLGSTPAVEPSKVNASPAPAPAATGTASAASPPRPKRVTQGRAVKKRITLNLDPDLYEKVRDAVHALSGPAVQMTLVRFVEEGLGAHLKKLQRAHSDGGQFPVRSGPLRTGRPLSR